VARLGHVTAAKEIARTGFTCTPGRQTIRNSIDILDSRGQRTFLRMYARTRARENIEESGASSKPRRTVCTKAALAAAKARGTRLGRYGAEQLAPKPHAAAVARAEELRPILVELAGKSTRQIAAELTARGIPTPRGGRWQAQSVANVIRHLDICQQA